MASDQAVMFTEHLTNPSSGRNGVGLSEGTSSIEARLDGADTSDYRKPASGYNGNKQDDEVPPIATEVTTRQLPALGPIIETDKLTKNLRQWKGVPKAPPTITRTHRHFSHATPRREMTTITSIKARSKSDNDTPTLRRQLGPIIIVDDKAQPDIFGRRDTVSSEGDGDSNGSQQAKPPVAVASVDLSIRYGRLSGGVVVAITAIVAFAIVFNHGWELTQFDSKSKDDASRTKLLNDYNSYTGNAASVLSKPIEPFVALAVQVVMMRVLRSFTLRTHIPKHFDLLTLALTTGAVLLINSSFNALNVQLRPLEIQLVIIPQDLEYDADVNASLIARTSGFNHTFAERSPRNPITNTVLRNLVLPRVPTKKPICQVAPPTSAVDVDPGQNTGLEYGFTQRDWQSRILDEAIEPKQIRMELDTSFGAPYPNVNASDLPMNASIAADLFITSLFAINHMFPMISAEWVYNMVKFNLQVFPPNTSYSTLADVLRILPPSKDLDAAGQREYFLTMCMQFTRDFLRSADNTSSRAALEFSHVEISDTMDFDAITVEFEVEPLLMPMTTSLNSTAWTREVLKGSDCLTTSPMCMFPKTRYPQSSFTYDIPSQVQAFAPCVNFDGTEQLRISSMGRFWAQDCRNTSTSSLMVVTLGKRLVADSLEDSKVAWDASTQQTNNFAAVTSLRKIFSVTVGKLSWTLSNLSADFNATCSSGSDACYGLHFPLKNKSSHAVQQELIVGAEALPKDLFVPWIFFKEKPRYVPLVRVHEPLRDLTGWAYDYYDTHAGEPLLLHNVKRVVWNTGVSDKYAERHCYKYVEDRLKLMLNNHMYIEHGLQTAYTAATFFVLQNGVVKDVIPINQSHQSLDFLNNTQMTSVFASVPDQNAWFTLTGCSLLVLSLGTTMVWSWASTRHSGHWAALGSVTTPHFITRVMLDAQHFPEMFLNRRVRLPDDEFAKSHRVDQFVIDVLALRRPEEPTTSGLKEEATQ